MFALYIFVCKYGFGSDFILYNGIGPQNRVDGYLENVFGYLELRLKKNKKQKQNNK